VPQKQIYEPTTYGPATTPLPLPDHCWEQVSHDLVTGLPKTPRGYDTKIFFCRPPFKRIPLVPTTSAVDAVGYARLFYYNIFRHFGLPRRLVSDRDPRFTSNYWKALRKRLGTNLNMTHLKQTARQNMPTARLRTCAELMELHISQIGMNTSLLLRLCPVPVVEERFYVAETFALTQEIFSLSCPRVCLQQQHTG
jgi:hypothetical protein